MWFSEKSEIIFVKKFGNASRSFAEQMLIPKTTVDICRFNVYDFDYCEWSQASIGRKK